MSSRSKKLAIVVLSLTISCVKPLDRNNPADPGGTNYAAPVIPTKRMFVTSTSYSGPLGGLGGADNLCQTQADSIPLGGTWKAWLSTATINAVNRVPNAHWTLVDGTTFIISTDAIRAGQSPLVAANLTEASAPVTGTTEVYTGTQSNGTVSGSSTCNNWIGNSSSPGSSRIGSTASAALWTDDGNTGSACVASRHLYCFEQ